jgi:formylglycine-generating enzyme required for sulfatase activity
MEAMEAVEWLTASPASLLPERLAQLDLAPYRSWDSVVCILPPLCTVPAGPFHMGSDLEQDSGAYENEKPQHSVTLSTFQIGKFPVTVAEYACFVRATKRSVPKSINKEWTWAQQLSGRLDHPVVNVSWHDAIAYAEWLAERTGQPWRLPSEAQWEKAARGTDGRIYLWGDEWDWAKANTEEGEKGDKTPLAATQTGPATMAG